MDGSLVCKFSVVETSMRIFDLDVRADGDFASGYLFFRTSATAFFQRRIGFRRLARKNVPLLKDKAIRTATSTHMRQLPWWWS